MNGRIKLELGLLEKYYEVNFSEGWVLIRNYSLPANLGWNRKIIDVCIQVPGNYPAQAPYGIYVPSELRINEQTPASNYQEVANNKPVFDGCWGLISWSIDGTWLPKVDITKGANLLNFVNSISDRFKQGRV